MNISEMLRQNEREDGADEIIRLREENEQLRKALKRLLLEFDFMVEGGIIPDVRADVIFDDARAAIRETGDE